MSAPDDNRIEERFQAQQAKQRPQARVKIGDHCCCQPCYRM